MCKTICPVCGGGQTDTLLSLSNIPVFVNVLPDQLEEAKEFVLGTQHLAQCNHCGFVFNCEFEPEKVMYDTGYHAERGHSAYYSRHISRVIDFIESVKPVKGQRLLEVACGGGEFLAEAAKRGPKDVTGVDPSAPETAAEPLNLQKALFDDAYLEKMTCPADILMNRHMIEHILNPLEMLARFHRALAPTGILYLETPRLDWILENRAFFDFPYEHCAYYHDAFIERLLKAAGFEIAAMENSYDGQYFSICARKSTPQSVLTPASEAELRAVRQAFSQLERTYTEINRAQAVPGFCAETRRSGKPDLHSDSTHPDGVFFWGAAAKGVMCANLLNQWPIAGFIDKNVHKQGKFIPGTGHPVLAPEQITYELVKTVIVENDVYLTEIQAEAGKIDPRIVVLSLSSLL